MKQLVVKEFAKVQVTRPDAGFEEKGGVDEFVRVTLIEIKGGNGFAELWDAQTCRTLKLR